MLAGDSTDGAQYQLSTQVRAVEGSTYGDRKTGLGEPGRFSGLSLRNSVIHTHTLTQATTNSLGSVLTFPSGSTSRPFSPTLFFLDSA